MATDKKKKVTLYWDSETLAIVEKIPSFYRSFIIREMIKKAASEGRLDVMIRDAIGIEANTSVPETEEESIEAAPSMDKSDYQSFKCLKRMSVTPTTRRYPPPRPSRWFKTRKHLRCTEDNECIDKATRDVIVSFFDSDPTRQREQEGPKSLNELPMCEVLGEHPRADRQTCVSCIVRPCPYHVE